MPAGKPRHADRVVVGLAVAGGAAQPGNADAIRAAPHRRLMRPAIALARPIVPGVAILTARMVEDLAGLHEEGHRAPGAIGHGGEGSGRAQCRVGLGASRARGGAHDERGHADGGDAGRDVPPRARAQDDLAPPAASRENGRR